jgi:hypothetical protein
MMKWILIGAGVLVLLVIGIVGLGWVAVNRSIDPDTQTGQAYAQGFKREFAAGCVMETAAMFGDEEDAEGKVQEMCTCFAEQTYEEYKNQPPIKLATISDDPEAQQRIGQIMQQCIEQAGLQ